MKSKNLLAGMSLALVLGGTMLATGCTVDNVGSNIDLKQEVLDSTLDNLNSYLQDMKDSNKTNEENLNNDSDYVYTTLYNSLLNEFNRSATEVVPIAFSISKKTYLAGCDMSVLTSTASAEDNSKSTHDSLINYTYKLDFDGENYLVLIEETYSDNSIKNYYLEFGPSSYDLYYYGKDGDIETKRINYSSDLNNFSKRLSSLEFSNTYNCYSYLLGSLEDYNYFTKSVDGNVVTYSCYQSPLMTEDETYDDVFNECHLNIVFVDGKLNKVEIVESSSGDCSVITNVKTFTFDFENVEIDFDKTGYTEVTE